MNAISSYFKSSIGRKQVVAVTGALLIGFVIAHLIGNLTFFLGPDVFNAYAKKLAHLRPALNVAEAGLLIIFLVHMCTTYTLVWENIKARQNKYSTYKPVGKRSLATRLMPFTGTLLLAYIIWHLIDFTFTDHHGVNATLNGIDLGLYGVVYNAFSDPVHSILYIIAMLALSLHLSHGIQSVFQTFGLHGEKITPFAKNLSDGLALFICVMFSTIPMYAYFHAMMTGLAK
ncbi:MAG: succinate dehydrogenase cytochrome b subunit [Candidatus Omnitrophica bacterium]|nr:succinate dehydrogenase cytochrome b subunit [Candidatus Omnitrophota bacterium]